MEKKKLSLQLLLVFLFFLLILCGCSFVRSLPVAYLHLKDDFDEQTLYNFFSNQSILKEAKEFFSVRESAEEKLIAREYLAELATVEERNKIKEIFNLFKTTSLPSIPILIAKGKFKGEKAFFLVEIWALEKERSFKWVRIWVFEEKSLRLLYALSFKNHF